MIDWDAWRASYLDWSYTDHVAFYDRVYERHPEQEHFDLEAVRRALGFLNSHDDIIEIGGWRGELAEAVKDLIPGGVTWTNYEICRKAVWDSVCKEPWYDAKVLDEWLWNQEVSQFKGATVLVASHVIEHMRLSELRLLLSKMHDVELAYIAAPLPETGHTDWSGYQGSHILDANWEIIDETVEETMGLFRNPLVDGPDSRVYG